MAIGVIISIGLSTKALREVREDRRLSQKPYLMFEAGGHQFPVEIKNGGRRIPGVNPVYAEKVLAGLPEQSTSIDLASRQRKDGGLDLGWYGRLKNFGAGPALESKVTWIPLEVWVGAERFEVTDAKRAEPLYSRELNTMPPVPTHIEPGVEAQLSRLPSFIVKDVDKKITRVEGYFELRCKDVFGIEYVSKQSFHLFTGYDHNPPYVHVTFSRMRD